MVGNFIYDITIELYILCELKYVEGNEKESL